MIKGTVKELESLTGFNQSILSVLLRIAEQSGQAECIGEVKPPSGRGKASKIWEVKEILTIDLTQKP